MRRASTRLQLATLQYQHATESRDQAQPSPRPDPCDDRPDPRVISLPKRGCRSARSAVLFVGRAYGRVDAVRMPHAGAHRWGRRRPAQHHPQRQRLGRRGLADRGRPGRPRSRSCRTARAGSVTGQPRHGRLARVADRPEPRPGAGLLVGRRRRPARRRRSFTVLAPGAQPGDRLAAVHRPADAPGAELHHHARRHPAGRHRALPLRRDLHGRQPLPHGHRVLGLQRRRARPTRSRRSSPRPSACTVHGLRRPEPAARHRHRRRRRRWPGCPASPPSASRCGGPAARAAPSTSSATRPTTTPTTPSRSWPTRPGWPTTRSAWSASATRVCRSSRRPAPTRPAWPPSPR